ncbi:hypothetical protein [Brevibacillus agri]
MPLIYWEIRGMSAEYTAMITALGSVVAYVLAEGYVDGKREDAE